MADLLNVIKKRFQSFAIGVDPARNLAKKANKNNILTINEYFNYKLSNLIENDLKFNFIFAQRVAHLKGQ